ncbi:MAG: S8 family serine peptidase [Rhodospirillaceae bacterium]|nr:S8 family serine peptidase [Rhodospirillaceae bacterium]
MTAKRALLVTPVLFVAVAIAWRLIDSTGESGRHVVADNAAQAAIERTLERTSRESRAGAEASFVVAAPSDTAPPDAAASSSGDPVESADRWPEGYSLGAHLGPMQRAPRTRIPDPEPAPGPDWLSGAAVQDAILDRAADSGRGFTFAVIRVLSGTDLQALNRSLGIHGSRIEGVSGEYVRVRVPAERGRLESIGRLPGVLGLGAPPPGIKADEVFVQSMMAKPPGEQAPVYISLMGPDPAGEWRRALSGLGAVVGAYDRDLHSYTANLTAAALGRVLAADFVLSVEPVPVVTKHHDSSVPVMGVDGFRAYDTALGAFSDLTGSGIAVGVLDTGLNTGHVDIGHGRESVCGANFVTDESWDLWLDLDGHGTHVFGTIAGAGRSDPVLAGVAPGLSHLRFGKVLAAEGSGSGDEIRGAMDYWSRPSGCAWRGRRADAVKPLIVNMSLAATSLAFSGRGVGERKLDSVVQAHSQLYVVAQANSGQHGFSNYGTAKNSLAVGAVDDAGILAPFSSHGPTADGRLAPNVVGTGVNLTSARGGASVSGHDTFSGTSMASPSVAGVAALLMEAIPALRDRPAVVRARLMAGAIRPHAYLESRGQLPADNTDGPGQFQNLYGLGLVSARTSLFSRDGSEGWLIGSASSEPNNDTYEYFDIAVPEGAGRLDVVLTWDEQPADTLTRSVLNNLDLWVDRDADCAEAACGEYASRSELDNVEWLLIEDPEPGTYRIKVAPVEVYGESSTAAVAWKILRGGPTPQLTMDLEDSSAGAGDEHIRIDVNVETSQYVASGTTLHLGCRATDDCDGLREAYLPNRTVVCRLDGLSRTRAASPRREHEPISLGEVAAGTQRCATLVFVREKIPPGSVLQVTATSWNAVAATRSLALGAGAKASQSEDEPPANDAFTSPIALEGATGRIAADLSRASREPGEPRVLAQSRTVWYEWTAPAKGLFRFRLRDTGSGRPQNAEFALFTGDRLVALDAAVDKQGNEISFDAEAGAKYRLRVASGEWDLQPLTLEWAPADVRPANDGFSNARLIEGESGSIESTNEGATLDSSEFQGGAAATVWYEWTAPGDGWWRFEVDLPELTVRVFSGGRVGELRLRSAPGGRDVAGFPARQGETYRIAVASRSADESGADFTLSWKTDFPSAAYNDRFENAIRIDGPNGVARQPLGTRGYIADYTVESGEPASTGIGTGWWYWSASEDGRYTWALDGSSAFRLTFFTGDALDQLQFVGSADGGGALVLNASAGTRYWIAAGLAPDSVGRQDEDRPAAFTWGPTPVNDERSAAFAIADASGSAAAALGYATSAPGDPVDTVGTGSVWWRWRAPANGWYRFWVAGHPVSTILSVYPDDTSIRAAAGSERSFLANGRVEAHLQARAGRQYDIRLGSRPGVAGSSSAALRWERSGAPAFLSYKGAAVTYDALATNPNARSFRSPQNLTVRDDGHYLFSSSDGGPFAFVRDPRSGEVALGLTPSGGVDAPQREYLNGPHIWWSARHERLFEMDLCEGPYAFRSPDSGSSLERERVALTDPHDSRYCDSVLGAADPEGRHFYSANPWDYGVVLIRADTPTRMSVAQVVSDRGTPGADRLVVPNLGATVDLALSPDGRHLYLLTGNGLFAFRSDPTTGRLERAGDVLRNNDPDGPFYQMGDLRDVAVDANGDTVFVAGARTASSGILDSAVAVFDIGADAARPAHLHTLTRMHFEQDLDAVRASSHLKPDLYGAFYSCERIEPHGHLPAVDVFCRNGYYVVRYNALTRALEVSDFAKSGSDDRFGSAVPALGAVGRQWAQSPDGAHVYTANSATRDALSDEIHLFERASAVPAN